MVRADRRARDHDAARVPVVPRRGSSRAAGSSRSSSASSSSCSAPRTRRRSSATRRAAARARAARARGSRRRRCGTRSCATSRRAGYAVPRDALRARRDAAGRAVARAAPGADRRSTAATRWRARCASGWSTSTRASRSGATATSRWCSARSARKPGTGGSAGAAYLHDHAQPAAVPRPVGDPDGAVTPGRRRAHARRRCAPRPTRWPPHYSRFRVAERLLLTGHSHQAWPDVGVRGAARGVGRRGRARRRQVGRARSSRPTACARGFARLLGDPAPARSRSGQNTHELVMRFLSALPLGDAAAARHDRRRVPHPPPPARPARRGRGASRS